jgi:hypothetical protein
MRRLKLKRAEPLSMFPFSVNLRRYSQDVENSGSEGWEEEGLAVNARGRKQRRR